MLSMQFSGLYAQVVINEFSCSNYTLNIGGDNEDFIEFYNPGAADVDLEVITYLTNHQILTNLKSLLVLLFLLVIYHGYVFCRR